MKLISAKQVYQFVLRASLILVATFFYSLANAQLSSSYFIKVEDQSHLKGLENSAIVVSYDCPFSLPQMQNTFVLTLNSAMTLEAVESQLAPLLPWLVLEQVPRYDVFYTPNDLNPAQYNLTQIQAELAWDINTDASSIVIAITDDAVDLSHPDLASNMWTNAGEIPGNGIDDDGNGFIDDFLGWDFGDADNDPNPNGPTTDHGTHVAGIASVVTDNTTGIASIGSNAKMMALKMSQTGVPGLYNGASAVDYAIANGADIINMSWGGGFYSQTYQDLFDIAHSLDIACIAAAGNNGNSNILYPAGYNYVIAVGSTDQSDQKSPFSNYGNYVDVAAPGSDIYSTIPGASYDTKSGTSMASPLVSGLVALMMATNPLATLAEIEACLYSSCDPVTGAFSANLGAGRINAFEALKCITAPTADFTSDFTQICPGNAIQFFNYSSGSGITFNWSFPGGVPTTSTLQNPVVTYPNVGSYDVSLTVNNGFTNLSNTATGYVTVSQPSAVISGYSNIVSGGFGSVIVNFVGNGPFDITLFDGTNSYPVSGITTNPYQHFFNPTANTTYTLTGFSDSQCAGAFSGSALIDVSATPSSNCDTNTVAMIKYLGTNIDDASRGVLDMGVHGYLIYGTKNVGASTYRTYVSRISKCGTLVWEKLYDPTAYGLPVSAVMEGNEILLGGYSSPGTGISGVGNILARLDLNGIVIDAKRMHGSNNTFYPRMMEKLQDGNLVFGGVTNSTPSLGSNDSYLVKTQTDGTVLWRRRFGGTANDFLHNVYEDNSNNILALGYLRDYNGYRSGYVAKHDANGNELWMKRFDMAAGVTYTYHVTELNGFYYVTGMTDTGTYGGFDGLIIKLDMNGNTIWSKKLGGAADDKVYGISNFNDTLYLMGTSGSGASNIELFIARMDENGVLIDNVSFGTADNETAGGHSIQFSMNSSGGYYGVGAGNGGNLGGDDILFFKFNSYADVCQPSTVTMQASDIAMINTPFASGDLVTNWAFNAITYTPQDVISNQGYICLTLNPIDSCNVTADFSMNPVYCFGDSIEFIDQSVDSIGTISLNIWDFGDGTPIEFAPAGNHNHLYNSPGTYNVQLIAIDTLLGCADTVSHSITIVAQPQIDLIDYVMVCPGDTVNLLATSICLSAQATIDWSQDSVIVVENGLSSTVVAFTPQFVYITVIDGGVTIVDSVFIDMDPMCCSSEAIISLTSGSPCANDPIMVEQNSTVTGVTPIFNWQFLPDGAPATFTGATPPAISFPTSGVKTIILTLVDDCGVYSDTVAISIFDPPTFNMGLSDTLCSSQLIQLGEDEIDDWIYNWTPGIDVSDSTLADPTIWVDTTQTIVVEVIDPWTGCVFTDSITFLYDSVYVNILMSDTTICNDTYTIPVESYSSIDLIWTPTSEITSYFLDSVQANIIGATTFTATAYGFYGVCEMTDQVTIENLPPPTQILWDTTACTEDGFLYFPSPIWYDNGTPVQLVNLQEDGIYYFSETNQCGHVVHEIEVDLEFCSCEMYVPNSFTPDGDNRNDGFVPMTDCNLQHYRIEIYNRWGELIFESFDINEQWYGTYKGKTVQDGTYTWKIEYADTFTGVNRSLIGHISVLK